MYCARAIQDEEGGSLLLPSIVRSTTWAVPTPNCLHYIICQSCSTRLHLTCARPQPILRDCRLAFQRACNSPYGRECGRRYRGPTQELIPPTVDRHESAFSSARSHPASIQTRIPLAHFAVSRLTFVNWALRLGLDEMWSGILRRRWS